MTPLNFILQKMAFKSLQPKAGMTSCPRRRRERSQPARLRLRRQSLPTSLPSPVNPHPRLWRQCRLTGLPSPMRRSPCHPACLWWEVPGPTATQCLPGLVVLNITDHIVVIGADKAEGQRDATTHQIPATRPSVIGMGSGPSPHLREGPAPGERRRSGLPTQPSIFIVIRLGLHWIVSPGQYLGTTTGLNMWRLNKDWQAGSPGYSGRACTSG